jgi:bacteriocin-like protein
MEQKKKIRETKELNQEELKSIYGGGEYLIYVDEKGVLRIVYK